MYNVFSILLPAALRVNFVYGCVTTTTDKGNKYAFGKFSNSVTSIPAAQIRDTFNA